MRKTYLSTCVGIAAACLLSNVAKADVVTDWNEVALNSVVAAKLLPPDQSRAMAMVHVAMFDAVNAIEGRYRGYLTKERAPPGASKEAAAATAARAILIRLFPDAKDNVEKGYAASLAALVAGNSRSAGISLGEAVAADIFRLRSTDGTGAPNMVRPSTAPGVYVPTTLPVSSDVAAVKPWTMDNPAQFRPGPPPELMSAQWAQDYNEILELGGKSSPKRTPEQTDVARFWAFTGVATWNPIVRQLAAAKNLSMLENARLFARVHVAGADAYIAVFEAKYQYNFWRPITAIRNGDIDSNEATQRDPGWLPLIDTPPHPEYPCAHCITSSAVATVLAAKFGPGQVASISMTSPTAPGVTRKWDRIVDYVEDVSNARVWGGVHYRASARVAREMGIKIGEHVIANFGQAAATR